MKKSLLVLIMFLVSTSVFAVAYNAEIAGCEITTQHVKFKVSSTGFYYLSVPFDSSLNGWKFLTPLSAYQSSATGGNSGSFFVVTDAETSTPVVGRCL